MPQFANPYSDVNAASGAAGAIGNALLQGPLLKQRQQMEMLRLALEQQRVRAEQEHYKSQVPMTQAHTQLYSAQAGEAQQKSAQIAELIKNAIAGGNAQRNMTLNLAPTPQGAPTRENAATLAQGDLNAASVISALLGGKPQLGPEAVQGTSINKTLANPSELQSMMLATKQHPVMSMPAGATLVDILSKSILGQSPREIPQGGTLVPGGGGPAIGTGQQKLPTPGKDILASIIGPLLSDKTDAPDELKQQIFQVAGQRMQGELDKSGKGGKKPTITTKEDFDKLPLGTHYIGKGGQEYVKPN